MKYESVASCSKYQKPSQVAEFILPVTVLVMPEEDLDELDMNDVRTILLRFRHGGRVNTTKSAVRVTHLPTGIVASCQDGKCNMKMAQCLEVKAGFMKMLEEKQEKKENSKNWTR